MRYTEGINRKLFYPRAFYLIPKKHKRASSSETNTSANEGRFCYESSLIYQAPIDGRESNYFRTDSTPGYGATENAREFRRP